MVLDERAGGFLQQPQGAAFAVGRYGAAVGHRDVVPAGESGQFEGAGVGHTHVAGNVDQVDGMAVADGIQLFGGGVRAEAVLVVTGADHPGARRGSGGERVDGTEQVVQGIDGAGAQVHLERRLADVGKVAVGVVEARHHGRAAEIVHGTEQAGGEFGVQADDAPVVHADGTGQWPRRILGVEDTVCVEGIEQHGNRFRGGGGDWFPVWGAEFMLSNAYIYGSICRIGMIAGMPLDAQAPASEAPCRTRKPRNRSAMSRIVASAKWPGIQATCRGRDSGAAPAPPGRMLIGCTP